MVKENTGTGKQPVSFAVIGYLAKYGSFNHGISTFGSEGSHFISYILTDITKTFDRASVIKYDRLRCKSNCFDKILGADTDVFEDLYGLVEGQTNRTLISRIIKLIGLNLGQYL